VAVLRADQDEAARSLETCRRWKGLFIPFNASGMASDGLTALLLETLGQHAEAKAAFEAALAFCRRSGYKPELARACRDYGEALVRQGGGSARAVEVLAEGLAVARSLGMAPTTARIQAALERARSGGAARGAGGLSPREIEVLRLVARGLTNAEIGRRLFISPNTVARHIQNVLEKTGMANRTEATAWAFRAGIAED
jgi:DNA-binding CsgD family transcriptional regulator